MNLQWHGDHHESRLIDHDVDISRFQYENLLARIKPIVRGWKIDWWLTIQKGEDMKSCFFDGTLEEAKAYALALVRLGAAE